MKKDHKIQISHRKVADLLPSAKNARLHSDAQLEQVAKSIREFGFVSAILVDGENNIIAGHGRVLAARKLGMKDIPCIDVSHLTETQRQALAIADNKIPLNAAWDMHMLQIELQDLQQKGFDLDLLAFSGDELSEIFGEETAAGQTADDAAAVVKGPPVSKPGDLWILGEHRLLCGSATEPAHVKRLMDGELAACVFTDPPYDISYNSADCKGGKEFAAIENDDLRGDKLIKFLTPAFRNLVAHTTELAAFYIWHSTTTRDEFLCAMRAANLREKQYIMWVKPHFVFGRADYHSSFEPCFYGAKGDGEPLFHGDRKQETAWFVTFSGDKLTAAVVGKGVIVYDGQGGQLYIKREIPKANEGKVRRLLLEDGKPVCLSVNAAESDVWEISQSTKDHFHPTQKPIELATKAIRNSTLAGEIVLDLFLGSGCTLMGAQKVGRRCFGTELEPRYVDGIVHRWQSSTGLEAKLDGTKKSFEQIMRERSE